MDPVGWANAFSPPIGTTVWEIAFDILSASSLHVRNSETDESNDWHRGMSSDILDNRHCDSIRQGHPRREIVRKMVVNRRFCPGFNPDIITDIKRCRVTVVNKTIHGRDVVVARLE